MEPQVKKIKPGGIFAPGEVEYYPIEYTFADKSKGIIICNNCQGSGKRESYMSPGAIMKMLSDCEYCEGAGTLKLKQPIKSAPKSKKEGKWPG